VGDHDSSPTVGKKEKKNRPWLRRGKKGGEFQEGGGHLYFLYPKTEEEGKERKKGIIFFIL